MVQEPVRGVAVTPTPVEVLRDGVLFVLVRPLQSGNVGAVARAMKNMGLRHLAVVDPPALDVDRARWMAPSAAEILDAARYCGSVAQAVAGCQVVYATTARARHNRWPAVETPAFAKATFAHVAEHGCADGPTVAVLFGPEDRGLGNDELVHAHWLLHIPTDVHASLNLGQAALLVGASLFSEATERGYYAVPDGEGRRGGPARGAPPGPSAPRKPAPMGAHDPLVAEWLDTLELVKYFQGHDRLLVEGTLRRILQRAAPDHQEVSVLRGMLRKLRWRIHHSTPTEGE